MRNYTVKTARMLAIVACALLLLGVVAGCTTPKVGGSLSADQKGMLEAVGKWYAAQGALDMQGFKAGIHDPDDILGVATLTAPPAGAVKSDVTYAWVGETVVISVPADAAQPGSTPTTVTLSPSKTATNVVDVKDSAGGVGTYVMVSVGGVWKIDVAGTQKAAAEAEAPPAVEGTESVPTTEKP